MEKDLLTAEKVARLAEAAGGRAYYVGGFVRDGLLGIENKDVDVEVHGVAAGRLFELLKEIGEPLSYGSEFGIYSLKGSRVDVALPRSERATGRGHRDFEVFTDPFLGTEKAARRRDFTVNAMMWDILSGDLIDHFGGLDDLAAGVLRHVDDDSFSEDPLRVLRAAQFAARFGFSIAPETVSLCRSMDVSALSRERVEEELRKALLKADKPSVFFESLAEMEQLDCWFPEILALRGVEQDPRFHPEGDVWVHTMQVLDRAAELREKTSAPYAFMLLALLHDVGKPAVTQIIDGRIHAYGHESAGLEAAEAFLGRITGDRSVKSYVINMIPLHMKPNMEAFSRASVKSTNRMFDAAAAPEDLIYFAIADRPVMSGDVPFTGDTGFLFERLKIYEDTMARPFVSGKDLLELGFEPGEYFSEALAYAHKLRLAGIEKESALKQTAAYARKLIKKNG